MHKKQLKKLLDINAVIAVYAYTLPYATIPLLIVKKDSDRSIFMDDDLWVQGGIILTKQDIKQGKDVFALRFAHMQRYAEYIGGKDVFADMTLKQKEMRHALEMQLRILLIDLREYMVQGSTDVGPQLSLTLSRIAEYIPLIGGVDQEYYICLQESIDSCNKETIGYDILHHVYDCITALTRAIDTA